MTMYKNTDYYNNRVQAKINFFWRNTDFIKRAHTCVKTDEMQVDRYSKQIVRMDAGLSFGV